MTTARKLFTPVGFKALGDDEPPGTFEAIVSVFDNVDAHGDIIRRGAFVEAIKKMKKTKSYWPVVFSHQHWDLDSIMGITVDAAEVKPGDARIPANAPDELKAAGGLWVKGRMTDLEDPFAAKVWTRMKDGRIVQWSYAYDLLEGGYVKILDDQTGEAIGEAYEFRKLDVLEVGPTLLGANSATRTLALKARAAGRPRLAKTVDVIAELGADATAEDIDAALDTLEAIATADVEDLTGEDDDASSTAAGDASNAGEADERNLALLVAEVVVEVIERRRQSTTKPKARSTVTADSEGKARGKTDEDRTGGKSAEDQSTEDRTASAPSFLLTELEALALEVEA